MEENPGCLRMIDEPVELTIPAGFVFPENVPDKVVTFRQVREFIPLLPGLG